ncbi:MAG: hypothetical protein AB7H97_22000 [Pseudobdellovibrionaceae bacterium]
MNLRGFFIFVAAVGLSGCSLYQSSGRKALEKNAIGLAMASANMTGCQNSFPAAEYLKVSENEEAAVYASEREDFAMAVVPLSISTPYSCNYRFNSAQEMIERTDSAIELTIQNFLTAQSLGQFAFHKHSPLK